MPEFLTVEEVGEILRMEDRTVYHLVSRKKIPSVKIGGKVLIPKREFEEMIEAKKQGVEA